MGVYNYMNNTISGEKWLMENVIKNLGDNIVIFDVGAHIGDYTKSMLHCGVKAKKIICFEPNPHTFEILSCGFNDNNVVTAVQMALSDHKGEIILYDRADEEGSQHASLSEIIFSDVHHISSSKSNVQATTIDSYCELHNIKSIDFLKIDVEGFELNVLQGARKNLSDKNIKVIQFEFTQLNSSVGVFFKQFFEMLSVNYRIYRLLPNGLSYIGNYDATTCEIFGYQNYVAILNRRGEE